MNKKSTQTNYVYIKRQSTGAPQKIKTAEKKQKKTSKLAHECVQMHILHLTVQKDCSAGKTSA